MLSRIMTALFLSLLLSACVLQSEVPIIAASDGEPLLKDYGLHFANYSLENGAWKKENDAIAFTIEGKHYTATTGDSSLDIAFQNISGAWWAMQAVEKDKGATYLLVEAKPSELLVYPVSCSALEKSGKFGDTVEFKGDDCFVKDGTDAKAMFKALLDFSGPAEMKLVPEA
jgi:hypothetical protein